MPRKYRVDLEQDQEAEQPTQPVPELTPPPTPPPTGGSDTDTFDWYKGQTPPAEPPQPVTGGGSSEQGSSGAGAPASGPEPTPEDIVRNIVQAAAAAWAVRNPTNPVINMANWANQFAQGKGVSQIAADEASRRIVDLFKGADFLGNTVGAGANRVLYGTPPPAPRPVEEQSPDVRQERANAAQAQRMAAQEQQQQRREAERAGAPEVGKPGTGTPPPVPPEPPKDESQPLPPPPVNTGVVSATGMSPQKIAETIDTNIVFTTLAANMGWTNEQKSQFRNYVIDLVNKGGTVPNLKDPNVVAQVVNAAAKTYNPDKAEAPAPTGGTGGQGFLGSNPYQPGTKAWNDWQIEHDRVINQSKGKGGGGGGGSSYGGTPAPTPAGSGAMNFSEIPFPTGYDAALERVLLAAGFDKLGDKQFSGSGKVTEALLYSLINDPQQQAWLRNFLLQQKLWKV